MARRQQRSHVFGATTRRKACSFKVTNPNPNPNPYPNPNPNLNPNPNPYPIPNPNPMFIQGMQACFGDDYEPRVRKQEHRGNGEYAGSKNGVPQNIITVKYILHAYNISYTTFKRMKQNQALVPGPKPVPKKNKGKSVFEDKKFAKDFYSPYRMYLKQKYAEWLETEVGRNADAQRKKVQPLSKPDRYYQN
jgi:hypothetical protein